MTGNRKTDRAELSISEAEEWLLGLEVFGIELGLERIEMLLGMLGSPQRLPAVVHVVGSNGKSSVTRMIGAILDRHSVRSGVYLSPHFISFTERLLIAGEPTSDHDFAACSALVRDAAGELLRASPDLGEVTQFEALTAIAFLLMNRAGVEVAVIEAGLGGRLDATNVVDSVVAVCTTISLEHTALLGETIEAVAAEKLDVVKPNSTLVVPPSFDTEALRVAIDRCAEQQARLVVAGRDAPAGLSVGGEFQRQNFALAAAAAHALLGSIDAGALEAAAANLSIPGRYQTVASDPLTIFDGAHNAEAARALAASIELEQGISRVVGCLSVLDDKDADVMLSALAACSDEVIFTRSSHPRAVDPAVLQRRWEEIATTPASVRESPHAALRAAREAATDGGLAYAAGSLYLIADLLRPEGAPSGSTL